MELSLIETTEYVNSVFGLGQDPPSVTEPFCGSLETTVENDYSFLQIDIELETIKLAPKIANGAGVYRKSYIEYKLSRHPDIHVL